MKYKQTIFVPPLIYKKEEITLQLIFCLRKLKMWVEVGMAYLKALSRHLLGEPEEYYENLDSK
jgi:hypothetical protein